MSSRAVAGLLALSLGACDRVAPPEPAATFVDGTVLPSDRLAQLLVLGQPLPLDRELGRGMARHWVEMDALARRFARGDSLTSPGDVEALRWVEIRGRLIDPFVARHVPTVSVGDADVDAAYEDGILRLVAQILRRAGREAHPEERARQGDEARSIRRALTSGMPWPDAVGRSEDAESRVRTGLLGLVRRGDLDPALDTVVFRLRPGELSGVVESALGYHVLYRPALADIRPFYRDLLAEDRTARRRADWLAALTERHGLVLDPAWEARMREIASDPWSALEAVGILTRFDAGAVEDSVGARYLLGLEPDALEELSTASAAELESVLRDISAQEILWRDALADAGEDALADAVTAEREALSDLLDGLRRALARADGERADPAAAVGRYMEAVVARRTEIATIPAALRVVLLRGTPWAVSDAGVDAALRRAGRLISEAG